jgi:hypothetical protein
MLIYNLNINYFFAPIFLVTGCRAGVLLVACGASSACAAGGLPLGLAGPIGRAYSFVCGLPTGLTGPIGRAYSFVLGLPLPLGSCCISTCANGSCTCSNISMLNS